jgi:putative addiction module component (TIGR02574 family)
MLVAQVKPETLGLTTAHPDIARSGGDREILDMTKEALLSEILRLPPEERVQLLGEAWDAVAASADDVPVPEWHLRELERRLAEPAPQYVPWEEVRERLKGSR